MTKCVRPAPSLSRRVLELPRSPIRRIFNNAGQLQKQGVRVVRLDIGDPDFPMPDRIAAAIKSALAEGKTHYSPTAGIDPLRRSIASHLGLKKGLDIPAERIVVNQGASQALNASFHAVCDVGTSILIPEVYFPLYAQQAALARIEPRYYPLDGRFEPCVDRLPDSCDDSTRALLINSPSNPTGVVFPADVVRELYDFARRRSLWIISDEAYADFVFEGDFVSTLTLDWEYPVEERRVLGLFSFSKSYAATGLRMGWTVAPNEDVATELGFVNEPLTGSMTTPLQWGMVAALEKDDTGERRNILLHRRQLASRLLAENGIEHTLPAGGIFYFLDISRTGLSGTEFADALLEQERVSVVPGTGFGPSSAWGLKDDSSTSDRPAANFVRISFAVAEDQLHDGLTRLGAFFKRLEANPQQGR